MNNKGYTLVELIATVVILSIVMGIATVGVVGVINRSKEKSEKIFVDKLENVIQTYINKNRYLGSLTVLDNNSDISFEKCRRVDDDNNCDGDIQEVKLYRYSPIQLSQLADEDFIKGGQIINPKNKKNCITETIESDENENVNTSIDDEDDDEDEEILEDDTSTEVVLEEGIEENYQSDDDCKFSMEEKINESKKVYLYKDSDNVYYYYADLFYLYCDIDESNRYISNIPKNVCKSLETDSFVWNSEKNMCIRKECA